MRRDTAEIAPRCAPLVRDVQIIRGRYDTAKLANCGLAAGDHEPLPDYGADYLRRWGAWVRAQLAELGNTSQNGVFAPSCLDHAANLDWRRLLLLLLSLLSCGPEARPARRQVAIHARRLASARDW